MSCESDDTELALTQRFIKFVVVEDAWVVHDLHQLLSPVLLFPLTLKEEHVNLIGRNGDHHGIKHKFSNFTSFGLFVLVRSLDVTTGERVHVSVLLIALLFVNVDFIALQWGKMRIKLLSGLRS